MSLMRVIVSIILFLGPLQLSAKEIKRVGFYGGTFDPLTFNHINIARQALEKAGLDRIYLVPMPVPDHKPHATPAVVRIGMVDIALNDDPRIQPGDSEIYDNFYYYEALGLNPHEGLVDAIRRRHPQATLVRVAGGDTISRIPDIFRDYLQLDQVVVFDRSTGIPDDILNHMNMRIYPDVSEGTSSTVARKMLSEGRIPDFVPRPVIDYILDLDLYQARTAILEVLVQEGASRDLWSTCETLLSGIHAERE